MQTNSSIILAGRSPDIVNALNQGVMGGQQARQFNERNALNNFVQANGADIMAGDAQALNALASQGAQGLELAQSTQDTMLGREQTRLGMEATRQGMQATAQRMRILDEQQAAAVRQEAASLTAQQRAAEAARAERAAAIVLSAQTPEQFDMLAQQHAPEYVGQFAQRDAIAAAFMDVKDVLEMVQGPDPMEAINLESAQIGLEQDRIALEQARNPTADPSVSFDNATDIRKEFNGLPAVKAFSEQASAYGRIQASASDPSPAGDLALIFNYMKVLDPGSVVRESEFATAAQASAWLQESEEAGMTIPRPVAAAIRMMATGERLSPEQRADFVGRSTRLYENAEQGYQRIREQYTEIAERNQIPVNDALIDYSYTGERVQQQPDGPTPSIVITPEVQGLLDKYQD